MIDSARLLASVRALPAFPAVLTELLRLLRDPKASTQQFERAMLRDPALTANVLRMANSSVFGLRRKVVDVAHAINLLGAARISELALTAGFRATLPESLPGYGLSRSSFLAHSVAVGLLAERIAKSQRILKGSPLFVSGLLHDIGKLVLASYLHEVETSLVEKLRGGHISLLNSEQELLGTDHTAVSALVGKHWGLPEELVAAAEGHHEPGKYAGSPQQQLVDVIHVANIAAHAFGYGYDVAGLARRPDHAAFGRLGLKIGDLERLASDVLEAVSEATRVLSREEGGQ